MSLRTKIIIWTAILLLTTATAGCSSVVKGLALPPHAEIAFISWRDQNLQIRKMTSSGSRYLTNTINNESHPVWSPDGKQLAFLSTQNQEQHLAVMNADGSNQRLLAKNIRAKDVAPAWAFDSQMIAFACIVEQRTTLCLASVTGDWMQIMPGNWGSLGSIQWAPADPIILFHAMSGTTRDVFTYTTYSNTIRNLTHRTSQDYAPAWSPDGRKIAFVSNRNQQVGIYTMNIDGTSQRLLLYTNIYDYPAWSPDGNQIAFSQAEGKNHLCIFNTQENILHCTDNDGSRPTWSPDGQFLVYESRRRNKSYLYLTDNQFSRTQQLPHHPAGSFSPAWQP
jgi:Tol biopolymer transport system component